MKIRRILSSAAAALAAVVLPASSAQADYTLQILHYYGESGLLGVETGPIMGAMIDRFDDQYANTLVIGEGDSFIPGPWLIAGADPVLNSVPGIGTTALARPDIAIMNAFGTTASSLGNHEFDLGSPVLQAAIAPAGSGGSAWVDAQFPLITANLNFAGDSSLRGLADATLGGTGTNAFAGLETSAIKAKIAPYAVVTKSGEKIGIVGATTFELLSKSSPNGTVPKDDGNPATDDLQEVAVYLQAAVNALQVQGVNKIVLVDQLDDLARNKALAGLVSGIDIMVAGGGHERLGDANDVPHGFNGHGADFIPTDTYPIMTTGLDGKPVLIVTTDTEYSYLGRLVVDFDANGEIVVPSLNPVINGAYASTEANLQAAYGTTDTAAQIIAGSVIGSKVQAIVNAINGVIVSKDGNIFGYTNVYMEGDRVFGRTQEVNFGNVSADANIIKAKQALGLPAAGSGVFSLKNGGGLRASVGSIDANGVKIPPLATGVKPAGAISQLDIENALRFDNKMMVFDTNPQGLLNILNFAAGLSTGPANQNGGYAQIGNLRFSYNSALPAGQKVRNVALVDDFGNLVSKIAQDGALLPGAQAVIPVVCLNFTANGGDGYPIKANASNFRYLLSNGTISAAIPAGQVASVDFTAASGFTAAGITANDLLGEQKAFQDYLLARHATPATAYNQADTAVQFDTRIQQLAFRADAVFANSAPTTLALSNTSVTENNAPNFTVGTLSAVDDIGDTLTFSLVAGSGDTDNGKFSISGNSLTLTESADFETQNSYAVRVAVSDGTLSIEKAFNITVVDVTGTQTLTFAPPSFANGSVDLTATGGASGNPVTFSVIAGTGSITGSTLTFTGSVTVRASQDGNGTFEPVFVDYVISESGTPTEKRYLGLLQDDADTIQGWVRIAQSRGNLTASATVGTTVARVVFKLDPATKSKTLVTPLGTLVVQGTADNKFAVTLTNGVEVHEGLLLPAVLTATPAKYNLGLNPQNASLVPGAGYGTINLRATGDATVALRLPDNTSARVTSFLTNDTIVVYGKVARTTPLAFVGGSFTLENLTTTDVTGTVQWNKPASTIGGLHSGGVNTTLDAFGCVYTLGAGITGGGYDLHLSGGNFSADYDAAVTVANSVPSPLGGPLASWASNVKTGMFTAKVRVPGITRPVSGMGVLLPKSNQAWGLFPGTSVGGKITLTLD